MCKGKAHFFFSFTLFFPTMSFFRVRPLSFYIHTSLLTPSGHQMGGGFSRENGHQMGVPPFDSVLTLSTWRSHQTLQAEGSLLQDWPLHRPTSDTSRKPRWSVSLLDQRPQCSPWGSANLLEQLAEVGETRLPVRQRL